MDIATTEKQVCCFIGHREISATTTLARQLYSIVEELVAVKGVDTFLFGSKSYFNSFCYAQVTKLKEKYPYIKRIYVRAEFPQIDQSYYAYLLERYEDTYYPEKLINAGKAVYVERNRAMIDRSDFCVFYCQDDYNPKSRKSGTKLSFDYAVKTGKNIIRLP